LGGKFVCPAQHDLSEDFILELFELCNNEELPILMGGDFNLIRNNKDRNKGQDDPRLIELFNNFIDTFQLREIFISSSRFTWSNKQRDSTLIKLDKILMSESQENNFSTCFAWSKARVVQITVYWFLTLGSKGLLDTHISLLMISSFFVMVLNL
jgi:hypothetical protein